LWVIKEQAVGALQLGWGSGRVVIVAVVQFLLIRASVLSFGKQVFGTRRNVASTYRFARTPALNILSEGLAINVASTDSSAGRAARRLVAV
jgi:hypothetical protein